MTTRKLSGRDFFVCFYFPPKHPAPTSFTGKREDRREKGEGRNIKQSGTSFVPVPRPPSALSNRALSPSIVLYQDIHHRSCARTRYHQQTILKCTEKMSWHLKTV
eukprot:TRINITY_DN11078_c0_g1_i9.p1 TRINITY_DN11078_c0_g1~~TRINITY_DN11078_c0_g1_i9.p1  ORF type:complete len:105 (-),score=12.37 TRINITY_DN11078_c0_g1_i9:319-633(-)